MSAIQPFDAMALLNQNDMEWQDQVGQLQFAGILKAIESKLNEIVMKVNGMDADSGD